MKKHENHLLIMFQTSDKGPANFFAESRLFTGDPGHPPPATRLLLQGLAKPSVCIGLLVRLSIRLAHASTNAQHYNSPLIGRMYV